MEREDIITLEILIKRERQGTFYDFNNIRKITGLQTNYTSSYLFVRGYMIMLEEKFGLDRIEAAQKFLDIVSGLYEPYNGYSDLASPIGMSIDELYSSTTLQEIALNDIKYGSVNRPGTAPQIRSQSYSRLNYSTATAEI
jgi:hypothetical protein